MIGSMLSALLLLAQPVPPAEPANGADEDYYETTGSNGVHEADASQDPETPAEPADQPAQAVEEEPDEELICRRRLIPSERVGERFRSQRVCKTRDEWEEGSRRR